MPTTKDEAVREFVARDLNAVPQEWVKIVTEHHGDYPTLPMWGTMWIVDNFIGEDLVKHSRRMVGDKDEIDLDDIEDEDERARVEKAIKELDAEEVDWSGAALLENYIDEEMQGALCVLDKDGNTTALYVYDVGGEYVIGVNGAGWNFYHGVWDMLYDLLGFQWHTV